MKNNYEIIFVFLIVARRRFPFHRRLGKRFVRHSVGFEPHSYQVSDAKGSVERFLRRTKDCSPLRAFECPGMPYFTGFLTNVGVRISLEYTPQIPGCR